MAWQRLKPRRLMPGDTIAVVAPAGPPDPRELTSGMERLRQMGFVVRTAAGIDERNGYLAGSDASRTAQLQAMFADDAVAAVICARGGYGALRLLAGLDYASIRSKAKPFIGFSDITALHAAFHQHCAMVTFHGPGVTTLGKADPATLTAFHRALTSPEPLCIACEHGRTLCPGEARGVLVGGNLTTLNHLLATPFALNCRAAVLLIEDTHEAPYRIDRMLTQMRLAGRFDGLAGVVAGSFDECGTIEEVDRIVADCFAGLGIPVLTGCAIGHTFPNYTVPLGTVVRLDSRKKEINFLESAFREE